MKAIVYQGPKKFAIEDVERPSINPCEVLIKPRAVSICGSDLSAYKKASAQRRPPLIMGHEVAGDVVEVGADVTDVKIGDRVFFSSYAGTKVKTETEDEEYLIMSEDDILAVVGG